MKRTLALLGFTLCTILTGWAQEPELVRQKLATMGFEDLRVCIGNDTAYVSVEDHTYRGTFRGAAVAIQSIAQECPGIRHLEVLLTDYRQPQLIVHATKSDTGWDVRVDRQMRQALLKLRGEETTKPSAGKIDITLVPMVSLVNNKLDHLFDYNVRIAPTIATTLWKGARLTIQPIFPILSNLDKSDNQRAIQIGHANLSQQILSTKRWQVTAAAGFFHPERLGVQANIGLHAFTGLDLYLSGGYTAQANYSKQHGFGVTRNSDKVNFMAKADYYEHHSKLQLELQAGRFLYGDYGGRFDVTRHFSEYAIGVYAILTGGEHNFGFHFAIPMGGKRQRRNGFVRVRLPEYFNLEYSMQSYFKYWQEKMGRRYSTQPDENRSAHYWEPKFVEQYVSRILNGTFK